MTTEQTLQERLIICASDSMINDHERCMFEAADRIDELERQLAEAQKDQARLDWIDTTGAKAYREPFGYHVVAYGGIEYVSIISLRDAIDKRMEREQVKI